MTDHTMGATSANHVGELLSDYINDDLGEADRQVVDAHLRECPRCVADLRTLRLTVTAVRRLPLAPAPRSFAILAAARAKTPVTTFLNWSTRALAAALVLILAVGLIRPIVAPDSATSSLSTNSPAGAVLPPQLAKGPPSDLVKRAAAVQQVARATAAALGNAATPTPAAAAAAAPASAPAAAPAPANPPAAALSQNAATSNGSAATQPPPAPAAAQAPAAVPTPATASYPGATTSVTLPTPAVASYPGAATPGVISTPPAAGGYPYEGSAGKTVTPLEGNYPAPGAPAAPVAPVAPTVAPTAHPVSSGPTTWFTPALVLLLLLAVVSAVAMSWLGRRGR